MSQKPIRRPARKRQPSERAAVAEPTADAVHSEEVTTNAATDTGHDPGGWLAIGLMAIAMCTVGFIVILTWMAA